MIFGPRFVTVRNSIKCKYLIVRLNTMVTHGLMRLSCFFLSSIPYGKLFNGGVKKVENGGKFIFTQVENFSTLLIITLLRTIKLGTLVRILTKFS